MKTIHNVQVYPVYAGHVNDHKVIREEEFKTREDALMWVESYNQHRDVWHMGADDAGFKAVYTGAIDDETGENL